jgi:acyl-coenzyme A synthetase/AMP-(fatty) acid ligase
MAMTNLLLVLASGARLRLSSALGDRLRPLRHLDRSGATHVRVAPRFIDLAAAERRDAPVGTLRVWASGGDRLYASQVEALFALGVPNVVNTYGTSESLGFASAAVFRAGAEVPAVNGAATIGCGRVGPWRVEIAVVEGAEMLAVRTPYLPGPYLFGEASGGFPSWVAEDVVLTGDTGTADRSMLFCTGRAGRQVKRHGRFVDLDHVDTALRAHHRVASFTTVSATGGWCVSWRPVARHSPTSRSLCHRCWPPTFSRAASCQWSDCRAWATARSTTVGRRRSWHRR